MHRRDFLLLRHPSAPRSVEISCERLHMSYLDLQTATIDEASTHDELSFAEPPAAVPSRDIDDWFRDLEADLADVNVVYVVGREWLRPDALRTHVDALLNRLSRRGVRIEQSSVDFP